jgi:hypothetical protein
MEEKKKKNWGREQAHDWQEGSISLVLVQLRDLKVLSPRHVLREKAIVIMGLCLGNNWLGECEKGHGSWKA